MRIVITALKLGKALAVNRSKDRVRKLDSINRYILKEKVCEADNIPIAGYNQDAGDLDAIFALNKTKTAIIALLEVSGNIRLIEYKKLKCV